MRVLLIGACGCSRTTVGRAREAAPAPIVAALRRHLETTSP